jgi:hypothetical protein
MNGSFPRRFGRLAAPAWLLAASLIVAFAGAASAQDDDTQLRGTLVEIVGEGGDVQAAGASVTITGEAADIQAAGATVTVRATATGNVQLAGAQVQFDGKVGNDLQVAGANIAVRGRVARNVESGSAVMVLNAIVGGDVRIGAANLTIGPGTDIAGELKAGAANLTLSGHVAGKVDVAGGLVTINARTDGDVTVRAAQVVINPAAQIGGNLTVYSLQEPIIGEGASIAGTVTRYSPPSWWQRSSWTWMLGLAAYIAAGTVLTGIVMMLFGGRVFATATGHVRHRPVSSFFFGILALILIPFVAVVLMVTVIGISAGIAIGLVVPFLIVFGHAIAAAGIAAGILVRRQGDIGVGMGLVMLIVGAILLVAIGLIPYVGPALVAIALILGVGAFTRTVGGRIRRPEPPTAVIVA